ncbi:MAG: hypothetical protein GXY33_03975 [Phycisphaerae bacterium]|nr:hypothetical protein [Phycisphaerae bacterium]
MKRRTRFILLLLPFPLIVVALAFCWSLFHVPDWYHPVAVPPDAGQEIRDELTELTRVFNNSMQQPAPFEFVLSQDQVNRLISGRAMIDPRFADLLPHELSQPAVAWQDGCFKAGAIVQFHGAPMLASLSARIHLDPNNIEIHGLQVRVGAWPVPQSLIQEHVEQVLSKPLQNLVVPNRFRYPNSDYDVRVEQIRMDEGNLVLTIQPIPR